MPGKAESLILITCILRDCFVASLRCVPYHDNAEERALRCDPNNGSCLARTVLLLFYVSWRRFSNGVTVIKEGG